MNRRVARMVLWPMLRGLGMGVAASLLLQRLPLTWALASVLILCIVAVVWAVRGVRQMERLREQGAKWIDDRY